MTYLLTLLDALANGNATECILARFYADHPAYCWVDSDLNTAVN